MVKEDVPYFCPRFANAILLQIEKNAIVPNLQYFVFSSSCNEQERRAKKAKKQQQQLQQQTSQAAGSAPAGKSPRQLSSSSQPLQNQVFGHYEKSVALKYSLSDHWKQIEDE